MHVIQPYDGLAGTGLAAHAQVSGLSVVLHNRQRVPRFGTGANALKPDVEEELEWIFSGGSLWVSLLVVSLA